MERRVKGEFGGRRGGKTFSQLMADAARPLRHPAFEPAQQKVAHADFAGLEARVLGIDEASHIRDAMLYGTGVQQTWRASGTVSDSLTSYSDAQLVMEMIKRGYAVAKARDGAIPEVLTDAD